jgi:hypothetical protein
MKPPISGRFGYKSFYHQLTIIKNTQDTSTVHVQDLIVGFPVGKRIPVVLNIK